MGTIGSVTGTATYNHVRIWPEGNSIRVQGTYMGEDTLTYEGPEGCLCIDGMEATLNDEAVHELEPDSSDGWIFVTATEDYIHISSENKEESDNKN